MTSVEVNSSILSEESIYGLRLAGLLEKVTEVLRSKFHKHYPLDPKLLYQELTKRCKTKLQSLLKQKIICREQYSILLPKTKETDSSKFDISLLTFALRELCGIEPPVTGWNSPPLPSDGTEAANLVRIRKERNDLLHHSLKYSKKGYEIVWDRIATALEGLGCNKQELIDLNSASLDPVLQVNYRQKLQELNNALQRVADLEASLEGITYHLFSSIPSFTGREEELSIIHQQLSYNNENHVGMVIYGLGGVGKSELVRQYCQRHVVTYYKRNVMWINGEYMLDCFREIAEIIKLITHEEGDKFSEGTIIHKVYSFFAERPVLFVFDNVIDKSKLMDFLKGVSYSNISILITSQLTEWGERFSKMRLDVLSMDDAANLIVQNLDKKHKLHIENVNRLCQKVQYFPLALQQATAYIKRRSITLDKYLDLFENETKEVMAKSHNDEIYNKTVMTTWKMALQKLKEQENSDLAINLLNYMSYLYDSIIEKELFYEYYNERQVEDAIELLQKYSLISITADDNSNQRILMHSLVQYVVRSTTHHNYLQDFLDMIFKQVKNATKSELKSVNYGRYWWYQIVYISSFHKEWHNILLPTIVRYKKELFLLFESKKKLYFLHDILVIIREFEEDAFGADDSRTLETQRYVELCVFK